VKNLAGSVKVEGINKKVIVKINDVGPLKPRRIIDFDEQTMRYFDPTLRLGLLHNIKVTALSGHDWAPGPIAER
jgi:rare lipoprotein A